MMQHQQQRQAKQDRVVVVMLTWAAVKGARQ
jgi:hypothetical protein